VVGNSIVYFAACDIDARHSYSHHVARSERSHDAFVGEISRLAFATGQKSIGTYSMVNPLLTQWESQPRNDPCSVVYELVVVVDMVGGTRVKGKWRQWAGEGMGMGCGSGIGEGV
jgi:hypothetical protein